MAEWSIAPVLPAKGGSALGGKTMSCIYILYSSARKKFYTGSSKSLVSERLREHNMGKVRSTKSGRPWEVIYEESQGTYTNARKGENFLKSGVGRQWIKEKFGKLKN